MNDEKKQMENTKLTKKPLSVYYLILTNGTKYDMTYLSSY